MAALREYRVTLHEMPDDLHTIEFLCQAEDSDHAREQALNAYPAGKVVAVVS